MAQAQLRYVKWKGGTLDTLETGRGRLMYRSWPLSRGEPRRVVVCIHIHQMLRLVRHVPPKPIP